VRATLMYGAGDVRIEDVPDAKLIEPTDALLRVTRAAVCGSDLWPYKTMEHSDTGRRMGHEFIGVIEAVGADIQTVKAGDLVVSPFLWSDGDMSGTVVVGFDRSVEALEATADGDKAPEVPDLELELRVRPVEAPFSAGEPERCAGTVLIDAASLDTGNARRDQHLRSADFFDAENHPVVRFTSTSVTHTNDGRINVSGELEAAGKRIPLAFDASVHELADGDIALEARTVADHRRFGMTWSPLGNAARPRDPRRERSPQRATRPPRLGAKDARPPRSCFGITFICLARQILQWRIHCRRLETGGRVRRRPPRPYLLPG
jgi:hypothetical protein